MFVPFFIVFVPPAFAAGNHWHALYYEGASKRGDILVNEVCPTITTEDSYFNALGWDVGCTGMQDNDHGKRKFIFSLWDRPALSERHDALAAEPMGALRGAALG